MPVGFTMFFCFIISELQHAMLAPLIVAGLCSFSNCPGRMVIAALPRPLARARKCLHCKAKNSVVPAAGVLLIVVRQHF